MNLTVLENRLAAFNYTMKSIADDLHHFRDLIDKEIAEKESRKNEHDAYRKRDLARCFVAHKGDKLEVIGDFNLPSGDVDPDKRASADTVNVGEILEVTNVDALSNKYETAITLFRTCCGIDCTLDIDQIRKLLENDLVKVVEK